MSIQEIEAAIAALPENEQEALIVRVYRRIRGTEQTDASRAEQMRALIGAMDRMAETARARGLTENKLNELLADDD